MSGHSKWSKIKRDKAANDNKKGAIFTKLGNQIAIAARAGVDPNHNANLAMVIANAKACNMPQSTIDRAIKRAADKASVDLEEILYEGYGQAGVAILVQCATDNRRRTYPEVKHAFVKNGGRIAETGAVKFNFKHSGEILVKGSGDQAILSIIETGGEAIEDVHVVDQTYLNVVVVDKSLHEVVAKLNQSAFNVENFCLSYIPKITVSLSEEQVAKVQKLVEALENLTDVVYVYTNLE